MNKIIRFPFHLSFALALAVFLFTLSSCWDADNIVVPINTSLPLVQINYSDSSLFALNGLDDVIYTDNDGVLAVSSQKDVTLLSPSSIDDLFKFPDQDQLFSVANTADIPPGAPPGTLFEIIEPINYDVAFSNGEPDVRIDEVVFDECEVRIEITNAPEGSDLSQLRWKILELKDVDGTVTERNANQTYTISNCTLSPKYVNDSSMLSLVVTGKIPPMDTLKGRVTITCIKVKTFKGYVGHKVINVEPQYFDFTNDFAKFAERAEEVYIKNPTLRFNITNQYNVPILVRLDSVTVSGKRLSLANDVSKRTFLLKANSDSLYTFDNSNTIGEDLSDKLNIHSTQLTLATTIITNPTAAESGVNYTVTTNSLTNTDSLFGKYRVDMPFVGYVRNVNFTQEYTGMDLSLDDENSFDGIDLAFTGENGMQLDFTMNLFTTAENGDTVEISEKPVIIPAALDEAMPMYIDSTNIVWTHISKENIELMNKSQKLIIGFSASTRNIANKEIVRMLSPVYLKLNLMAGATMNYFVIEKDK
ncbi:MAG: hypothetical protein LBO69_05890 [Ignavibacteria bacterium]|jgi:hypothetical protein|nr:hypothetical protein [Ignavibacteria bacterium]